MLEADRETTDQREQDMGTQADKVREALKDAMARGWERIPASPGCVTLRWSVELPTPKSVREAGWWTPETYTELTFVTFIGVERISAVANTTPTAPWTNRHDSKVSVKRALELLASLGNDKLTEPTPPTCAATGRLVEPGMRVRIIRRSQIDGGLLDYTGSVSEVLRDEMTLDCRKTGSHGYGIKDMRLTFTVNAEDRIEILDAA